MERREELKSRARELERGDKAREALDLYLEVVADPSGEASGPTWTRIGDLQLQLGDRTAAARSFDRAMERFAGDEQLNSAITLARRLLEADPSNQSAWRSLADFSLRKGYRRFAAEATVQVARAAAEAGRRDEAVGALAALLERYPDEVDAWRGWVDGLVAEGRTGEASSGLRDLHERLAEAGRDDVAARLADALHELDPDAAPLAPALHPPEAPGPRDESILEPTDAGVGVEDDETPVIALLAGLEPTHAGAEWDDEPSTLVTDAAPRQESAGIAEGRDDVDDAPDDSSTEVEPLPLLDTAGDPWPSHDDAATEPPPAGLDDPADLDEGDDVEPLPLLGTLPEFEMEPGAEEGDYAEPLPELQPSPAPVADLPAAADEPPAHESRGLDVRPLVQRLRSLTDREADAADASTHYDLALAYKEMDLHEDAIARFAAALEGGHDPFPVLEVVGEILVGRARHEDVQALLLPAIRADGLPGSALIGLNYWLGRSAEALEQTERAIDFFGRVVAVDPDFRDAADRLRKAGDAGF